MCSLAGSNVWLWCSDKLHCNDTISRLAVFIVWQWCRYRRKNSLAWLINGILVNSEVWHSVSNTQIEKLMAIDKYLLRGLVGAHAKVPLEHLYLELADLPLSYVISAKRMIYLQTILKRPNEEIIKQVYKCQQKKSCSRWLVYFVKGRFWKDKCTYIRWSDWKNVWNRIQKANQS